MSGLFNKAGKALIVVCSLPLVAILGLLVFHLGPSLHLSQSEKVLDSMKLQDGSRLLLAQKANKDLFEAYTVILYRVNADGKVEKCLIGFEESYWWLASLKPKNEKLIDVRSLGVSLCTYNLETKTLTWNDNSYPPRQSSLIGYQNVPHK